MTNSMKEFLAEVFVAFQAQERRIFEKAKKSLGVVDYDSASTDTKAECRKKTRKEWTDHLSLMGCRSLKTYDDEVCDGDGGRVNIPDPFWYSGPNYLPVHGSKGFGALAYIEVPEELAASSVFDLSSKGRSPFGNE